MNAISRKIKNTQISKILDQDVLIDKKSEWVEQLLLELSENSPLSKEEILKRSNLDISIKLTRKQDSKVGETLVMQCNVKSQYQTLCVKKFENIEKGLDFSFDSAFIHEKYQNLEEYKELTDIYVDGKMRELYFFGKNGIDLFEVIHEQIYLNFDFYPDSEKSE